MIANEPAGRERTARPQGSRESPANGAHDDQLASLLRAARDELAQIGTDAARLLKIRAFRIRARARSAVGRAVGAAALTAGLGIVAVIALVFLLRGLAGALAVLFGGRPWLGDLACGVLVLAGVGAWFVIRGARSRRARIAELRRALGTAEEAR